MKRLPLLGLVALVLLPACTQVNLAGETGKTYRYFGFVELKLPETKGHVHAVSVESAGIALEDGLMIGWRDNERVVVPLDAREGEAPPAEAPCNLIVIVRSDAQAKHAREILSGLDGENICLTSFQ
jgi:hypothetical protein